ncbi:hypothetical protein HII28_13130 [Planctomonas sp. JC2975]|uniref:hypothetical protein n=1 Tax=Planctomonas sp. JC2975 TaxID=2729626 RepID=UPI001476235B|nr:hypothetical protein [Planctomonas sp. JC2975]NNC12818.1 hypothetical protein [Planctomonas sp. JC2975]
MRRLREVAVASDLVGAGLLALGVVLLWYTEQPQAATTLDQSDTPAQLILWGLRNVELPVLTVGLAALVLPVFLWALRSRLGR